MSQLVDLSGQAFAHWKVIARASNGRGGQAMWHCACVCGTEAVVLGTSLRRGHSRSCGCLQVERRVKERADAERQRELVAERADARRRLVELHALRESLIPDADDALVLSELSSVDGQIRAAVAVVREGAEEDAT